MTQTEALDIMKTGANVFLTGEPGAGKTHSINRYVSYLRSNGIEPAITASTGIAATHIGGLTIHSWSGIGIKTELSKRDLDLIANNDKVAKRVKAARVLIIDEISMLPPHALNMVDAVCRKIKGNQESFGGLQIILVGDFFQLPPIMNQNNNQNQQNNLLDNLDARFAYGAEAWRRAQPAICYLHEQYRQEDEQFLNILKAIRANNFNNEHLSNLTKRQINYSQAPQGLPKLYSHNIDVDRVNEEMLNKLPGAMRSFNMTSQGPRHYVEILQRGCLSPDKLLLKVGASVMFTKNSQRGLFANGTLGVVDGFDFTNGYPVIKLKNNQKVIAEPATWMLEDRGETLASITQLPLRLAWAITVHKSQGMSLDGAIMDLTRVFEYGQGYVALSRVRSLSGLYLLGFNDRAFQVSPEVVVQDVNFKELSKNYLANSPDNLEKLQDDFIIKCGGQKGQALTKTFATNFKKPKIDTYKETLDLWRQGKNHEEIAEARNLGMATILAHLEKLFSQGKIKQVEFKRLISDELNKNLPEIHQVFLELDTDKLGPVHENFGGQFSYDDLRLARLLLKKGKN